MAITSSLDNLHDLSDAHRMMAYMDAQGKRAGEIAEATGFAVNRVYSIRLEKKYQEFLAEVRREIKERAIAAAANLISRYDEEAPKSFETIVELRDGAENESIRLKAAEHIIDRAPAAPKVVKVDGGGGGDNILKIYLPAASVEGIQKALTDTGRADMLELLETAPDSFEPPPGAPPAPADRQVTPPPEDGTPYPDSEPAGSAHAEEVVGVLEPERL